MLTPFLSESLTMNCCVLSSAHLRSAKELEFSPIPSSTQLVARKNHDASLLLLAYAPFAAMNIMVSILMRVLN